MRRGAEIEIWHCWWIPFHDFANYTIFGSMGEDVKDFNRLMSWCRKKRLSKMRMENFTEVKKMHPTWRYD